MFVKGINAANNALRANLALDGVRELDEGGFAERLEAAHNSINDLQKEADASTEALASGQPVSLHDTMIAVEKSDLSVRLFVSMTKKAIEAYREVMRTQL